MMKILLALDLSPHSRRAADHVARIAPFLTDCQVTVLVVSSGIPYGSKPSEITENELHGDEDHAQEQQEIDALLGEVKLLLTQSGLAENHIETRIKPVGRGIALDIIDEAQTGGFNTIVVGRRGLSKVKSLLLGSVSSTIVEKAEGLTVWVVA